MHSKILLMTLNIIKDDIFSFVKLITEGSTNLTCNMVFFISDDGSVVFLQQVWKKKWKKKWKQKVSFALDKNQIQNPWMQKLKLTTICTKIEGNKDWIIPITSAHATVQFVMHPVLSYSEADQRLKPKILGENSEHYSFQVLARTLMPNSSP